MLVGENEREENREQDESAQKDKWADRTFLCTSCVLWSSTLTPPRPPPHPRLLIFVTTAGSAS